MRRAVPREPSGHVEKVVGLILFWLCFAAVMFLTAADILRGAVAFLTRSVSGGGGN